MAREQLPHSSGARVTPLPPAAVVQAALRTTTERLAAELASPRPAAPAWTPFEWRIARAVAVMHGVSGLLAARLAWHGPPGWLDFLREQHAHTAARQGRLLELRERVSAAFAQVGIPAQALKGAVLEAMQLYRPGERPMADLDVLVSPPHAERAAGALARLGLHETQRTIKHRVFEAQPGAAAAHFGEHADNPLKVEFHERICEPLPLYLTDITRRVAGRDLHPGLNPYPSPAALMAHLLLHAAGGMTWRTLRLIQLHDIALLAGTLAVRDWEELLADAPGWAWPPLSLATHYYGSLLPSPLAQAARAACPRILRHVSARQRLSDVSLSRLWIEPLPGIEWAQSPAEALGFAARRLVPSAQTRAERRSSLATEPSLRDGDWGRISQARRVLRVLRTRTPRPWPLHNVRAALALPH